MRYVSIDLETTGLDPMNDQVLMAALVLEDTDHPEVAVEDLPTFHCLVRHPTYHGSAFALHMNAEILKAIDDAHGTAEAQIGDRTILVLPWDRWELHAFEWLVRKAGDGTHAPGTFKITAAGKNAAGFDLRFLSDLGSAFYHRVLDPGSVFWAPSQEKLPDLATVKKWAGIDTPVAHDALEDARDVIRCLRFAQAQLQGVAVRRTA